MSFDEFESSAEGGRPIEAFEFSMGSTIFRWTSSEDAQSIGGNTFEPSEIRRGDFSDDPEQQQTLEVYVPATNPLAQMFTVGTPEQRITFRLLRKHRGDGEVRQVWTGKVLDVSFTESNEFATISVQPLLRAASRLIPHFTFSGQCQHVLGDSKCQVVLADFTFAGQVTAVSSNGRTLTIDGLFAAHGADWAKGGKVRFGSATRMVVSQIGDDVTLLAPFSSSPLGHTVDTVTGCDHTAETCQAKFGALQRYGGWPFIPRGGKNPFVDDVFAGGAG